MNAQNTIHHQGLEGMTVEDAQSLLDSSGSNWDERTRFQREVLSGSFAEQLAYAASEIPVLFQAALMSADMPPKVLWALAASEHTDPAILSQLAIHMDASVRAMVSQCPRTPIDALRQLMFVPEHLTGVIRRDAEFVAMIARDELARRIAVAQSLAT